MEQEQSFEFQDLRREVTTRLRHHDYVLDRLEWHHVLQYLILPSFAPPIAWDIFRVRKDQADEHVLMRSSWRSDLDGEKLSTPVERMRHPRPLTATIEVHQIPVDSGLLAKLAEELKAIELSIGATRSFGLDGVTYEIAIDQPSSFMERAANCRFTWWLRPPKEWSALDAWVKRAEQLFESAWKEVRGDVERTT